MKTFDMIVNWIVILGMFYLTFVMALAGWIAGLRKGEAVTLLPERSSRTPTARIQVDSEQMLDSIHLLIL
jgi:hypothetical protein